MKTPCVFVSDLAKILGEGFNGESDYREAFEKVVRRFRGDEYQGDRSLVDKERIQDIMSRHNLEVNLESESETLKEVDSKVSKASLAMRDAVDKRASESERACKATEDTEARLSSLGTLESAEAELEKSKTPQEAAQAGAKIKEIKTAQERVKEARGKQETAKRKLEVAQADQVTWDRDVRSRMQCGYGTRKEDTAIKLAQEKLGEAITNQQDGKGIQLFSDTDHPLCVYGRVDGMINTAVVEVKCRQRRFFGGHARWEKAQASAYCAIFGKPQVVMVEYLEGTGIQCTTEPFDAEYWETVVSRLEGVAIDVHKT
jgi:hypothetical protein